MQENSFEWFNAQVENAKTQIESWPTWMKNTADFATASFPVVNGSNVQTGSQGVKQKVLTNQDE